MAGVQPGRLTGGWVVVSGRCTARTTYRGLGCFSGSSCSSSRFWVWPPEVCTAQHWPHHRLVLGTVVPLYLSLAMAYTYSTRLQLYFSLKTVKKTFFSTCLVYHLSFRCTCYYSLINVRRDRQGEGQLKPDHYRLGYTLILIHV